MKTALVLSGGGAKGAFQAGVISKLAQQGTQIDLVCGTSAGSLNAAAFAFCGAGEMIDLWQDIRSWRDVFSLNWSAVTMRADGILGTGPLRKKVKRVIDVAFEDYPSRIPLSVSKVRLEDGRLMFANGGDQCLVDSVIASCSIPGIISPVIDEFTGDHYVDGGTRENVPLKRAIDLGADRVVVVLCSPWGQNPPRWFGHSGGWFEFVENAMRALDITLHEVMVNDIETCLEKNLNPDKRQIEVVIYAPQFEPCGTMDFNPEAIRKAIALGKIAKPVVLQRRDGRAA